MDPADQTQGTEVSPEATFTYEQHCLMELSEMTEMFSICTLSNTVATSPLWLVTVVGVTSNRIFF